ncbi:TPA: phage major capsid protein [Streptococcus suis]|nr:phage major capsid protein [Streptococcus suis]HEL2390866.1 phage major capsid protein [Streptococcus suis]
MSLINNDLKTNFAEAREQLFAALRTDNEQEQKQAFENFVTGLEANVSEQVKAAAAEFQEGVQDEAILAERGLRRKLTSAERKFFNEAVEKQKITGLDQTFPETIIEDIYRNLQQEHPMLSLIDMQVGDVKTAFIYGDSTKKRAFWGAIPADIQQILLDSFKRLDISQSQLSGYIAVPKGYYKLGPSWLASYVVTFLQEVMIAAIEEGIMNGTGKEEPLGMMRKLSGDSGGVYPEKEPIVLSDLTPKTLAGIRAALAKAKMDNGQVAMFVNPMSYWAKVFPKLAFRTDAGVWVTTQLPTGETIIPTHSVPENKLVFGVPYNYLMVVAGNIEIHEYRETLALQNLDLHIAQFFAKGIAKNENAFFVADIANIDGATIPGLEGPAAIVKEDTINPKVSI